MRRHRSSADLRVSPVLEGMPVQQHRSRSQVRVDVEISITHDPPNRPKPVIATSTDVRRNRNNRNNHQNGAINRLPFEILGDIFEYHTYLEWFAPVIDGAVCRAWRAIVLASPRVWAHLKSTSSSKGRIPRNIIKRWTSRVGAVPLHVHLEGMNAKKAKEVIPMVSSNAQCLYFIGHIESLCQPGVFFPMLERMSLYVQGSDVSRKDWDIAFPYLKELHLHYIILDWTRISLPPLQSLHIQLFSRTPGGTWYSIIQQCASTLRNLALDICETPVPQSPKKITLPRLRGLQINIGPRLSEAETDWLTTFLEMPSLTSIHEFSSYERPALWWDCPTLEEYSIYNCFSLPHSSIDRFPSLTCLGFGGTTSVISQQLNEFADDNYLPALEIFAYKTTLPHAGYLNPVKVALKEISRLRPNLTIQHLLDENCYIQPMFDEVCVSLNYRLWLLYNCFSAKITILVASYNDYTSSVDDRH